MARYEPKILINRTGETVEFKCGGRIYTHKPGMKKNYPGFVAYHALSQVNTGLEEYDEEMEQELQSSVEPDMPDYRALTWQALSSKAAKLGIFERGMNKREVIEALEAKWRARHEKQESKNVS